MIGLINPAAVVVVVVAAAVVVAAVVVVAVLVGIEAAVEGNFEEVLLAVVNQTIQSLGEVVAAFEDDQVGGIGVVVAATVVVAVVLV